MKALQLTAITLLTLLLLAAAAGQTSPNATGLTDDPVYQKHCAGCHGKTGEGRHFGGPALISQKMATASADELRDRITNGKGRMPRFSEKLTTGKIDLLVQQIQAANQK